MGNHLPAVVLAALAAACFAAAAVVQREAVSGVADPGRRLSLAALVSLARRPRWLTGAALAASGVALHAGALTTAPLSVVQPVGVLAVPLAVVAVFARARSRPPTGVVVGSALTVVGVIAFVTLAGPSAATAPRAGGALVAVGAAVAAVVALLAAVGLSCRGPWRSVGCAAAAAVAFGLVSVQLRTLLSQVGSGSLGVLDPGALALLGGMAAAVVVGGWLSQQALAAGAAAVSLSVLTVLDPVVAVTLGALVGDGGPASWVWPLVAVAPAVAGVAVLTRHHPAVVGTGVDRRPDGPVGPGPADRRASASSAPGRTGGDGTLRVLIGADTFPPDINGAARSAGRLAAGMAARGHRVHVIAPSLTGEAGTDRVGDVTVHHLRSHPWPGRPQLRFCLPWQVRRSTAELMDLLGPDVVHVQGHFPVGRALVARAGRLGVPVVATNHVVPDNFLDRVPQPFRAVAAACFWADLVRVLGHATTVTAPTRAAVDLLERAGLAGALAVSNGTDLPVAGRAASTAADDGEEPTVLFVGRLDREKHVEDLLRAAAAHGPGRGPLVEVVGEGPCRGAWTALAASLGLAGRVRFLGHLDEVELAAARRRAGVFVMPGTAELQSLATLEAMAVGLPVVAADAMALPHLVRPGVNGWLYPPGDAAALADRVAEVLADPSARARMGERSAAIAGGHDITATLEAFEALYDAALGRPARPARPTAARERALVPAAA